MVHSSRTQCSVAAVAKPGVAVFVIVGYSRYFYVLYVHRGQAVQTCSYNIVHV